MNLRIPAPVITRAWLARGTRLWIVVRIGIVVVPVLAARMPVEDALRYSPSGSLGVLALCTILGFGETRIRKERVFLANLGITDAETMALFALPAALGELLLALVLPW